MNIEDRVALRLATAEYDSWDAQASADSQDLAALILELRKLRAELEKAS